MSAWEPIETLPRARSMYDRVVVACFHTHREEDGEPTGEVSLAWAHVAYASASGLMVNSAGFKGLHGNASFPVNDNATHWQPLPPPPEVK